MNAYPAELVNHHYACMFVAGLLPAQDSAGPSRSRLNSSSASMQDATASSAVSAPEKDGSTSASASLPHDSTPSAGSSMQHMPLPAEVFPSLASDLCDIFRSRGRSTAWDPAQGQSAAFHAVLVDNNVRLPPRKTRLSTRTLTASKPEEQSPLSTFPARSPLSPLHPSSSLFPDGLIAPIWIRKHRDLVPAVYVAFFCLAEPELDQPSISKDEKQPADGDESPSRSRSSAAAIQKLKTRDEELIKIISDRKRMLSERGVKMTVVLLTTREMLESTALESRLSYIRRSSQLDSRASLFVLTPVSKVELGEFVTSLQSALYDAALDYYREHCRRVKRKRTRYPPNPSVVIQIIKATGEAKGSPIKDIPLSREGWLMRSSYKLGTFAEFSGNFEEALASYSAAYHTLAYELLPSTMLLPPRTRRWAEAKVLADTLSLRLSKIHLYRGNGDGAWSQFRSHVRRFIELSQGWGIGETTFEFWSWLGKQYRLMGDLLDFAMREFPGAPFPPFRPSTHFPPLPTFLLHPSHLPTPTASGNVVSSYNPQHGSLATPNEAAVSSSCLPSTVCLGAGDCFYIAGLCALERWQRYRKMLWEEQQHHILPKSQNGEEEDDWMSANLVQERKVEHAAQAIEYLTKAHEAFKRQKRQRSSLFVASKIVDAYFDTEQYEMASRFLERIVKTYQSERWSGPAVSQLFSAWATAERLGDSSRQVRLLWMLMSSTAELTNTSLQDISQHLKRHLKGHGSTGTEKKASPYTIELGSSNGLFTVEFIFAKSETQLGNGAIPFQIRIAAASKVQDEIRFEMLKIHFNNGQPNLLIRGIEGKEPATSSITSLRPLNLDTGASEDIEAGQADLSWSQGTMRTFQGTILPEVIGILQVSGLSFHVGAGAPCVLRIRLGHEEESFGEISEHLYQGASRWLVSASPPKYIALQAGNSSNRVLVKHRQYKLRIALEHDEEAYVQEAFAVRVKLINDDSLALDCSLDAIVSQGVALSTPLERSCIDAETAEAPLHNYSLGKLESGATKEKTIYLYLHGPCQGQAEVVIHASGEDTRGGPTDDANKRYSEHRIALDFPVRVFATAAFSAQWTQVLRSASSLATSAPEDDAVSTSSFTTAGDLQGMPSNIDAIASKGAIASLNVALTFHAREGALVRCVRVAKHTSNNHIKLLGSVLAADKGQDHDTVMSEMQESQVQGVWMDGDRWGGSYEFETLSEKVVGTPMEGEDGNLKATGHIDVEWARQSRGKDDVDQIIWNTARVKLPLLLPPHLLSRLIVSLPATVSNEQAFVMLITIVNPSKLVADVLIAIDDNSADFSVLNHKNFTVPNLLPRSTRSIPIHVTSRNGIGLAGATQALPASPRQGSATRQGGAASPSATLRLLPTVRAWQRDRRDVAQLQQQSQHESGDDPTTVLAPPSAHEDLTPIVNTRPGVGVPLEVSLRYTSSTRSAGASTPPPRNPLGNNGMHVQGNPIPGGTNGDITARLRTENHRSGSWMVVVQS